MTDLFIFILGGVTCAVFLLIGMIIGISVSKPAEYNINCKLDTGISCEDLDDLAPEEAAS